MRRYVFLIDNLMRSLTEPIQVYVLTDMWDIPRVRQYALRQLRDCLYRPSYCAPGAWVKGEAHRFGPRT
jgi:hypothetical protein